MLSSKSLLPFSAPMNEFSFIFFFFWRLTLAVPSLKMCVSVCGMEMLTDP